jgi:hypothetical protein
VEGAVHAETGVAARAVEALGAGLAQDPSILGNGWPSASSRSTTRAGPNASSSSNGPFAQLKPQRMARSTFTTSSAISGISPAA